MSKFFERQWLHLLGAALMIWVAGLAAGQPGFLEGSALGISASDWFWWGIWSAIGHQVWVWFWWRSELHFGFVSSSFGEAGFRIYAAGFALFSFVRLGSLVALGAATPGTLAAPRLLLTVVGFIFTGLVVYLMYSVLNYFSIERALGADHFDERYRTMGLEKRGIFAWVNNGMYIFGLLALWLPGLFYASAPALVAGLLSHGYIWVHFFATEKPDMERIYG